MASGAEALTRWWRASNMAINISHEEGRLPASFSRVVIRRRGCWPGKQRQQLLVTGRQASQVELMGYLPGSRSATGTLGHRHAPRARLPGCLAVPVPGRAVGSGGDEVGRKSRPGAPASAGASEVLTNWSRRQLSTGLLNGFPGGPRWVQSAPRWVLHAGGRSCIVTLQAGRTTR